jgi:hypothetical protein
MLPTAFSDPALPLVTVFPLAVVVVVGVLGYGVVCFGGAFVVLEPVDRLGVERTGALATGVVGAPVAGTS